MNVTDVERVVAAIRTERRDPEAAHGGEDALYEAVLRAIASGETDDPAAIAAAALKSLTVEFPRWCA